MKKLMVKQGTEWLYVFCAHEDCKVLTTDNKAKALPSRACWGADDLAYFQCKFANHEFKLA